MKHYEKLLFDVDGTLLDFDGAEQESLEQVLDCFGEEKKSGLIDRYKEINRQLWDSYEKGVITKDEIVNTRFSRLFEEFGIDGDGADTERRYRALLNESALLMDGALEVCEYLSGRYELYVVTNGFIQTQRRRMEKSGLDRFFIKSFISEEAGSQKPQKGFFDYCFAGMEKPDPSRMLIIGDSLKSDIKGGADAGIDTCWLNPEGAGSGLSVRIDYEIKNLLELKTFL